MASADRRAARNDETGLVREDHHLRPVSGRSLVIARLIWVFAVARLITMRVAISSLDMPRAARPTTSRSRLVRASERSASRPCSGRET